MNTAGDEKGCSSSRKLTCSCHMSICSISGVFSILSLSSEYSLSLIHIYELLDRLDKIPGELDAIHEKLYAGNMDRNTFAKLVDQRSSLYIEVENKERELKEVYKIKL